jgi:hypothetical protein
MGIDGRAEESRRGTIVSAIPPSLQRNQVTATVFLEGYNLGDADVL